MKPVRLIGAVVVTATVAWAVVAQPAVGRPEQARGTVQQSAGGAPSVTVEFGGGSLAEYVAAVRAAQPAANIVYTAEAEKFPVPAVLLRDAQIFEAAGLLNRLRIEGSSRLNVESEGQVFAISVVNTGPRAGGAQTAVWSLRELLVSGIKPEDLLSAIDTAVQVGGGNVSIKYHRETALLIARGSGSDLSAIDAVLGSLRVDAAAADRPEIESLAASVDRLQKQVAALAERVESLAGGRATGAP